MAADKVEAEFIIDLLEEQVADVGGLCGSQRDPGMWVIRDENLTVSFRFFGLIQLFEVLVDPFFRVRAVMLLFNLNKLSESLSPILCGF